MVADAQSPASQAGPAAAPATTPCLGVLFVHGAGDHGTGAALIEFGESLIAWLDGWLRHGEASVGIATDRALVGVTQILVREGDEHAPAHSYVRLRPEDGSGDHTWLLAEAHWDEAFTPPGFQQVLLWAIGVVPWTVLTQFIGPLARRAKLVPPTPIGVAGYLWRVVVAATTSLIVSAVVFALAILIVVLSLIPIDAVRNVVSGLQRFASTGVGDLYMVLTSPIQRAALTGAVQRDIAWLRSRGCDRVAVVAHSQGGYVAYQALSDPWQRPVELFVTFGSGLIRLTESDRARRGPTLTLALIGTVGALFAIRFLPSALLGEAGIWTKRQADGLAFSLGLVLSALLIVVLWRYFHEKSKIADLPTKPPWIDFLTTEDPVMNRRREGILPDRVTQVRTQNRGSLIADHGSYWQNTDEFVPQVAMAVADLDPKLNLPVRGPERRRRETDRLLRDAYALRHRRVSALRLRGSVIVAATIATIAVLLVREGQLRAIGQRVSDWFNGLPGFVQSLIPDFARSILPIDGIETIVLGAAVIAILSGLGMLIGSRLWDRWSGTATLDEQRGRDRIAAAHGQTVEPPPPGVRFYLWTFVHLVLLAIVAVVGPIAIMDGMGQLAGERDQIVQAWARQFITTFIAAGGGWLWAASPRRIERDARWRVVGGLLLALAVELVIAIRSPGPMDWIIAIPIGLVVGLVSLVVVWLVWPALRWILTRVVAAVEVDREPEGVLDHPASIVDYIGFIGVVISVLAAVLVFAVPVSLVTDTKHLWWFAGLLAALGAIFGFLLALNSTGYKVPTTGRIASLLERVPGFRAGWEAFARNTMNGSSLVMRLVGAFGGVVGGVTFAAAAGQYIAA
jgi:hypothetical protein